MQPTSRPTITAQDFMMGEPNRSQRMIVTKTRKPSPINSALPQGKAWGASALGQSDPSPGLLPHVPEPPAQSFIPFEIRLAPIRKTVGPVTMGGKRAFSSLLLMNESPISSKEHRQEVASSAPYPFGQGNFAPESSTGQYPVEYICANVPVATVIVANEVPTTETRPVPT